MQNLLASSELEITSKYDQLLGWLNVNTPAPQDLLKAMVVPDEKKTAQVLVGLATLEHMSTLGSVVIEGSWEDVLKTVIRYLKVSNPGAFPFHYSSTDTKYNIFGFLLYILQMKSACPNPYLRLVLISLFFNF